VATIVSIMDRDSWQARTDNLVVVDPDQELLLWVPRDLWSDSIRDRVNVAFARGGHGCLIDALTELGFPVEHSICLRRSAVGAALTDVTVTVPVPERLDFWYPLAPAQPIEDGKRLIVFEPPEEHLSGERIHQWIGARSRPNRGSSDFERIARQQVLVRCLLRDGFDFSRALTDPELVSHSDPAARSEVARTLATWRFEAYQDVVPRTIDEKMVLVSRARS
jgi:anionic cell wall polymer biosynthesis LytR-Cps2A-Psr (LCP) family protein